MSVDANENSIGVDLLRSQIKTWESSFQAEHGRKPERADIKKDATIAAKYKQYQTATRPSITSRKSMKPREALQERSGNGSSNAPIARTPSKAVRTTIHTAVLSPVKEVEPTPAHIRLALGPTPQKDGQVLGIFDLLSGTPSRNDSAKVANLVAGTPSKATAISTEDGVGRTPQSSSKRFYLDAFAGTPLKRKREDETATPSSSKRKFATPSFLRRSFPLASIDEDGADTTGTSMAAPFRKRGLVRSLSSIIQNLKKQEEERMDEDWDILNEIEEEQGRDGVVAGERTAASSKVLVQDSQTGDMPLEPDKAPESSEDEEVLGKGDRPRKAWKKKGLKRQTRRVIMRPVKRKPGKEGAGLEDVAEEEEERQEVIEKEVKVVPETQLVDGGTAGDAYESSGNEEESEAEVSGKKSAKRKVTKRKERDGEVEEAQEKKVKPKRKVNELAHANFCKLKIKNKNSKANGKGGGRKFGGRR
ncbi:dna replication regulator sld2 like protein [Zymoseptoria brevis]|uniref:DNA replication regulator SLD2 n=1 Tax=Zymoseptoria brevis TaxID=1047168 RepID=A0A0F4GPV4_9PEZI|nr:dna replication regulator sld2 like protein [Zymoseptoria brevis]